jgi:hypothetical protein
MQKTKSIWKKLRNISSCGLLVCTLGSLTTENLVLTIGGVAAAAGGAAYIENADAKAGGFLIDAVPGDGTGRVAAAHR